MLVIYNFYVEAFPAAARDHVQSIDTLQPLLAVNYSMILMQQGSFLVIRACLFNILKAYCYMPELLVKY